MFKLLKCRLAVEHFSGELPDSVRQDFLAKIWLGNLTYAKAALCASLPRLMTKVRDQVRMVKDLLKMVANTLEWLRPDRHFPCDRQTVKPVRYRTYKAIR